MNTTISTGRPKRSNKPTEGAAIIQSSREEAGLTRHELAHRVCLTEWDRHHTWACGFARAVEHWEDSIRKIERSHVHEPSPEVWSLLLALIDAGPTGTPDEQVLSHWHEFRDECVELEMESLREIGERFAMQLAHAKESASNMSTLIVNFFENTLACPGIISRGTDDPRYIRDSRQKVIQAALSKLATL